MTQLNILLTGSNGFVGGRLKIFLESHSIRVFTLGRKKCDFNWDFVSPLRGLEMETEGFDAVIHLAGATVQKRWTAKYIREMHKSRVLSTKYLVDAMNGWKITPRVFLCASAVGYYGCEFSKNKFDESSEKGNGILASLCDDWEKEASRFSARFVSMRLGVIMDSTGGMLKKILPIYKKGMGGRLGSGKQGLAWISLEDSVRAIFYCLQDEEIRGSINLVSPDLVNQKTFAGILGRVLGRPLLGYCPGFILKTFMGLMGEELVLGGRDVLPSKLMNKGFVWEDRELEGFLTKTLS